MLITDTGTIIRTKIASINTYSRSAGGVTVMKVAEGTTIVGFTAVAPEDEKDEETELIEGAEGAENAESTAADASAEVTETTEE